MPTPAVGEDIESTCMKCGGLMWHVVVAKVGDKIAKVQCKRCNNAHRLRASDPINAKAEKVRATGTAKPKSTRARKPAAPPPLPEMAFDPNVPAKTYRASERYEPGTRITHPTFGTGVVVRVPGEGKIEVRFPTEVRVLAQARTASTLERPATRGEAQGQGTPDAPPRKV